MCLDKKTKIDIKKGIGYKLFRVVNKSKDIFFSNWDIIHQLDVKIKPLPLNKWINEMKYRKISGRDKKSTTIEYNCEAKKRYKKGFHIYKNLDVIKYRNNEECGYDAMYIIYQVEFKNVVAQGMQEHSEVIVASDMKILKENKN
jgi:hypothetical protein